MIDCLGKVGDASAIDELVAALTDPMRNVREAAILALVAIADRHPDRLRQVLAGCEKGPAAAAVSACLDDGCDMALRRAAVRVLGWLGVAESVTPLLRLLEEEALQQEVIAALVEIGRVTPQALLAAWPEGLRQPPGLPGLRPGRGRLSAGLSLLRQGLCDSDPQIVRMSAHALGRTR